MIRRLSSRSTLTMLALLMLLPAHAGAKELPRGSAAPRAFAPCAAFGPGYTQIAGTDTCVRISGSIEVESRFVSTGSHHAGAFLGAAPH